MEKGAVEGWVFGARKTVRGKKRDREREMEEKGRWGGGGSSW